MIERRPNYRVHRVLIFLSILLWCSIAQARDPATSNLVDNVTANVPQAHRLDGATAYVGLEGCREMASANTSLSFRFDTVIDTTELTFDGLSLFDGGDFYSVERGRSTVVNCESGDDCGELTDDHISQTSEDILVSLRFRTLTGIGSAAQCEQEDIDQEFLVRIYIRNNASTTTFESVEARMILDTVRPDPPSALEVVASQSTLRAEFSASPSSDVARHIALVSQSSFDGGVLPSELSDLSPRVLTRIREGIGETSVDLSADAPVYVAIAAQDETGNDSLLTEVTESEVIETIGFWEYYKEQGGSETGGFCNVGTGSTSQSPFSILILISGFLFFVVVRRYRRADLVTLLIFGSLTASVLMSPAEGYAQIIRESPVHGLLEFKLGGYYPALDEEFGGADAPFESFFGSQWLWYGEFEYDYYLYKGFGKLAIGMHAGYSSKRGSAMSRDGEDVDITDDTIIRLLPLRLSAVYRYDYSALHHNIPLVPFVKAGLDYYLWQITGPDGSTAEFNGDSAQGGKAGWHLSAGLNLHLDFLDPGSAGSMDMNWGINNSYIFAEYLMANINGFGAEGFDFSDNQWLFGIAFEF